MPRNGSGTYALPAGNPVTTGTTISSTWANNSLSDLASAITQSVSKDGQTTMTGPLPMGGNAITGAGAITSTSGNWTLSSGSLTITSGASIGVTVNQNSGSLGILTQATAGNLASIGVAGNGSTFGSTSFDLVHNQTGNAVMVNRFAGGTLSIGTNAVNDMLTFASSGAATFKSPTSAANTLTVNGISGTHSMKIADSLNNTYDAGFLCQPVSTHTTLALSDRGKSIQAVGTTTVPNSVFAAGDVVRVVNISPFSITLVAGITNMYLGGTASVGNRAIAQNGWADVYFISGVSCTVGGVGVT